MEFEFNKKRCLKSARHLFVATLKESFNCYLVYTE